MAKCEFGQLARSSSGFKLALIVTIAAWTLVLSGLSGCVVVTPPPETPAAGVPSIEIELTTGPTDTPMTARDVQSSLQSTSSGDLITPDQVGLPPFGTATATVAAHESPESRMVTPTRSSTPTAPVAPPVATASPTRPLAGPEAGGADGETPTPAPAVTGAAETRRSAQDLFGEAGPSTPPEPGTPMGTATTQLNIRAGPGIGYPRLGFLEAGQWVEITGVSSDRGWWQIRLAGPVVATTGAGEERGWVAAGYVTARDTQNLPTVQAPALPSEPAQVADWRGEYFAGRDLAGQPALVRDDPQVNFDWQASPPASGLPVDNFSVRWTRALNFSEGTYRFYALVDDGVRLWIDGQPVIDQWHDSGPTTYTVDVHLTQGQHTLLMEYFEHTGNAVAQLEWEPVQSYPDWRGEYYANPTLSGAPTLVRNDVTLDFSWADSPGPGLPADDFSARWTRTLYLPGDTYRFSMWVDDGARLWVDDRLIIDAWRSGPPDDFTAEIGLSEGPHTLKLEYFEFRYGAQLYLNWGPLQDETVWKAEYFDNRRLNDDPVLERDDGLINFNWGDGSPGPGVPADNFSARWHQDAEFEEGSYIFNVVVDDGARLWVDGVLLIDSWEQGRVRFIQAGRHMSQGTHGVQVEYVEFSGHAQIEVSWERQ